MQPHRLVVVARAPLVPLVGGAVRCGFPSPAEDYLEHPLDFNELLVVNPEATFAVRATGDSMTGIGIFPGDIVIIDRARRASDRSIILAVLDGEFTLKRYRDVGGRRWLEPENPAYQPIPLTEDSAFEVWGVVSNAIRQF